LGRRADYDALLSTNTGIYEYEFETENNTRIFDCLNHGLDVGKLADLALLPDGSIIAALRGDTWQIGELVRYVVTDPSEDRINLYINETNF
jgi:hypothetical protein